ncbi:MAG: hypothetical protein IJV03_03295, partial [Alphaproteobacteria bacterium]|nr:hypothetical protein [Alphaproteobacteria bacterium]
PEGEGFYWNNGEYVCAKSGTDEYSGLEDTGLYTYTDAGKNTYTWCLTHTELVAVMGQDAEAYYVGDENVWNYCLAGSCCLSGKKYSCKKGTVSLPNMKCNNTPGQCEDCGGKTTKSEGTSCNGYQDLDTCKNNMCTVSITPTKFCIGLNSATGMCFEIEEIKMSLKDGVGVYNTNDITKTNYGQ